MLVKRKTDNGFIKYLHYGINTKYVTKIIFKLLSLIKDYIHHHSITFFIGYEFAEHQLVA